MSFICEHTGKNIGPGIPQHKVVVEWRTKYYDKPIKKNRKIVGYEKVLGREIVREINVSPDAYKELTGLEPRRVTQRQDTASPARFKDSRPVRPWSNPKNRDKNKFKNKDKSKKFWSKTRDTQQHSKKPIVETINPITNTPTSPSTK